MSKASIRISTAKKLCKTSDSLYGIFFEDINHAGDGGLYAEMLQNRAFEDGVVPKDCTYEENTGCIVSTTGWRCSFPYYHGVAAWEVSEGATMALNSEDTLNVNRPRSLDVQFEKTGSRLLNRGYAGLHIEQGKTYKTILFIKNTGNTPAKLQIGFAGSNGQQAVCGSVTADKDSFEKFELILEATFTDIDARFMVQAEDSCSVRLGYTSLMPTDTFMGRENGVRKDLAMRLKELSPAFLRFPGGCIVEGFSRETAMMFKNSIGPVWERPGHWLLWAYRTTNGLGYLEYLQFCEDMGIDVLYVCNCGMSCQARGPYFFDEETVQAYLEDTLHAIEYAMGGTDTEYGALRAAHGHPEPFKIKYLEIGNENYGTPYYERYRVFYQALKEKYPDIIYISNEHTEYQNLPTEMVDEHYYADYDFFISNHDRYDHIPAEPKIYVGEYATTVGCKKGNMKAALAEAAFFTGIERNQDRVLMTSYAPLFLHSSYHAWDPDLIVFNNRESYVIPPYHMIRMFASNRGDAVVQTEVETPVFPQSTCGGIGLCAGEKGIFYKDVTINGAKPEQMTDFEGKAYRTEAGEYGFETDGGWCVLGDNSLRDYTAEIWAKTDSQGKIVLRFWNRMERIDEQNHYKWELQNGRSQVSHQISWSVETITSGDCPQLTADTYHKLTVETKGNHYKLSVNGQVVHDGELKQNPEITAVCTLDDQANEAILKVVNVTDKAMDVTVSFDRAMGKTARATILAADKEAGNSFENMDHVSPVEKEIESGQEFIYRAAANSIAVLRVPMA